MGVQHCPLPLCLSAGWLDSYPSCYFHSLNSSDIFFSLLFFFQVSLADNPRAALMVRNRVQEALRVSALPRQSGATAPVFAYTRPVFVDQNRRFLSQVNGSDLNVDLFHTSHSLRGIIGWYWAPDGSIIKSTTQTGCSFETTRQ